MEFTKCQFSGCSWEGPMDQLINHCENNMVHRFFKRTISDINGGRGFIIKTEDQEISTYLLVGDSGLYWMRKITYNDYKSARLYIRIFFQKIESSEDVEFSLKFGSDLLCEGPYSTSNGCTRIEKVIPHLKINKYYDISIFLGPYDNNHEMMEIINDLSFYSAEYQPEIVEKYTCMVCLNYIRDDARICYNEHVICVHCFNILSQRNQLKCPTCRGEYPTNFDYKLMPDLLKMINFPVE